MAAGQQNLDHVMTVHDCTDPDCELHHPGVIEDDDARLTALAHYIAGGYEGIDLVNEGIKSGMTITQALDVASAEMHDDPHD